MSYLKVPTIANLQLGKREGQKRFIQNQSEANKIIKRNHKESYNYNEAQEVVGISTVLIPDGRKVKFSEMGEGSRIQGKILEEQIMLRSLESEYDLERSRIEDEHNAKTFRIRYPYGKENVRITEDVLKKYKGSNMDQVNVLKKFEDEAKQLKHIKSSQKHLYLQSSRPSYNPHDESLNIKRTHRRKATSILEREKKKLQKAKQDYLKQVEKSRQLQKKENKRIENIQNMLKEVKEKLNENFSLIIEKQHHTERQKSFVRKVDETRARLQNLRAVDMSEEIARRKLPVVVYNRVKGQQDQNFVNRSLCLDLIDFERPQKVEKPEEFQKVLKIYNLNKVRLDRLCQRITVGNNHSSVIY